MTKAIQTKKLQKVFNEFIRLRDKDLPCVSCLKYRDTWHAGHYQSTGAHPELRFNEDNCHKQCAGCNLYKSGNLIEYRKTLLERIGPERLDALESYTPPRKYSILELDELILKYKMKIKELKSK